MARQPPTTLILFTLFTLLLFPSAAYLTMGGTPQAEIKRQHDVACEQLHLPCMKRVNRGEIPLCQKSRPTCQLEETPVVDETDDALICVSSRGQVDVSLLQNLIREGYTDVLVKGASKGGPTSISSPTNLWNSKNAAKNNVSVKRPSHDDWGIKKVVLIFCDDFVHNIYEMPWWHLRDDMRQAVQPILNCLEISPNRVIRLLMAALPPGVTIPIHHDSGEWVRNTHRVHVPILVQDPDRILFQCGPTEQSLARVDCTPGHVFEMNNQAKHAVSNCSDDFRVHLILDYTEPDFKFNRRIQLSPGERVVQTRRSIDRLVEKGSRSSPSFMILGAQKAGTTSLYEYIVQHPWVVRPKRRETHCLDWRWNAEAQTTKARKQHCLKFFHTKELELYPSCLTGDSTPSYLLDAHRVIPRLQQVFDHTVKFFVMLRDPVARLHSHYSMVTSPDGTAAQLKTRGSEWRSMTLEEVVQKDLKELQKYGVIPYWDIHGGIVDKDEFRRFCGSKEESLAWNKFMAEIPINTGSHSLIARGLYDLQLRTWFQHYDKDRFLIVKLEDMKAVGVKQTMDKVWKHLELPPFLVEDDGIKNSREYNPMPSLLESYLQRFYEPHNQRLADLLEEKTWSYK